MKNQTIRLGLLILAVVSIAGCSETATQQKSAATISKQQQQSATSSQQQQNRTPQQQASGVSSTHTSQSHDGHAHGATGGDSANRVPAFQTDAASLKSLPPTLAARGFAGKQRLAYQVASEIPQTLAQLPCYCHCDRGFGHKSLHSCFVDDHAAHCAVCVDEALLAYRLQKEEKLSPTQIRERIISEYASKF